MMICETFPVGPLGCNCTVLGDARTKQAIVIDPGGDFARIRDVLDAHGLTVGSIVHTHTHIDHVGATRDVQVHTGAAARIHEGDLLLYEMLPVQAQMLRMRNVPAQAELDRFLADGEVLTAGDLSLEVIHTPGHTPGSVCFRCHGGDREVLFAGDTLFAGSIGRTDLPGGDHEQILRSIKKRLLSLPGGTEVIAGHDCATTIDREARTNPFLR